MPENEKQTQLATFAGGCFWCMVKPFDELPGIQSVVSGYTGGHTADPTYDSVGTETTGHAEAVQIAYDPSLFPYERLLDIYWQLIDPTDRGGQFSDRGQSYRTAIFAHNEEQRAMAEASKRALQASGRFDRPIVTEIADAGPFYPAEDEHQRYHDTHRREYNLYREGSGRDEFAERHWNTKKDKERLRRKLTDLQFRVVRNGETEPAYENEYWNNDKKGIYVDVVNGDPLFSSVDQFDSGTGWPSFAKPIEEGLLRHAAEIRNGQARTIVSARLSGAHLGYLFRDGPAPSMLHYRLNSAALRFVSLDNLEKEGYGRYVKLFEQD